MASPALPNEKVVFDFEGEKITLQYPNNGQVLDIEANKMSLSSGQYRAWILAGTDSATHALNVCDMIATLTTLAPALIKRLRVKSLLELTPMQTKKLSKAFAVHVLPWLNEWNEVLAQVDEEAASSEDGTSAGE